MTVRPDSSGEGSNLRNGVDHALRILRRRADDEDGAVIDLFIHRVKIGFPIRSDRGFVQPDAEEMGGLVEGRMGAFGHDHFGIGDTALFLTPFSSGEDGTENGFRPTTGEEACTFRSRVQ